MSNSPSINRPYLGPPGPWQPQCWICWETCNFTSASHLVFWDKISYWPGTVQLGWLVDTSQGSPPQHRDYKHISPYPTFIFRFSGSGSGLCVCTLLPELLLWVQRYFHYTTIQLKKNLLPCSLRMENTCHQQTVCGGYSIHFYVKSRPWHCWAVTCLCLLPRVTTILRDPKPPTSRLLPRDMSFKIKSTSNSKS